MTCASRATVADSPVRRFLRFLVRLPRAPVLWMLRLYKTHFSPELRSRTCRFKPSCALYAHEAISRFGAIRGAILSYRRVRRCAPEHPGGYDPVPKTVPQLLYCAPRAMKTKANVGGKSAFDSLLNQDESQEDLTS